VFWKPVVAEQRLTTNCRVVGAIRVAIEGMKTKGRISEAGCKAEKRILTSAVVSLRYPPSGGGRSARAVGGSEKQPSTSRIVVNIMFHIFHNFNFSFCCFDLLWLLIMGSHFWPVH
jgi:hypothetical protein